MDNEQKQQQVKKGYKKLLELLIKWGCNETVAKVVTGAVIGILIALCCNSCKSITPQQIYKYHEIYHKVSNSDCIFEVENTK